MTPKSPPRRVSGPVIPHRATALQRLMARSIWGAVLANALAQRWSLVDPHGSMAIAQGEPMIYAIWHNRLFFSLLIHRRYIQPRAGGRRLAAMVSASRDGALLSAVLNDFGVQPVRGSSSRRGSQALLELKSWADQGLDIALTPDGPRGPAYAVQSGVVALARLTGRRLVPAALNARWKLRLKSWDRFQIPLPFGPINVVFGPSMEVSEGADELALEEARAEMQRRMLAITVD